MSVSGFFFIFMTESITPDYTQVLFISSYALALTGQTLITERRSLKICIYVSFIFIDLQIMVMPCDVCRNLKRTS